MIKEKLSPLKRRERYLKKGVELVVDKLFKYIFENEQSCLDLEERVRKIEKKLKNKHFYANIIGANDKGIKK